MSCSSEAAAAVIDLDLASALAQSAFSCLVFSFLTRTFAASKLNITLKGHYRRSIQFWKIMQTLGPYHASKPNCLFEQK